MGHAARVRPAAVVLAVVVLSLYLIPAGPAQARATTIGSGATFQGDRTVVSKRPELVHLIRVDLRKNVRIVAAAAGNGVGAPRETVAMMAGRRHALGGINGDYFDETYKNAQPFGGLVIGGHLIKTARSGFRANFVIRGGRASIGPVDYTTTVTRTAAASRPAISHSIYSSNTLNDAKKGRLTIVDHDLYGASFGQTCRVATAAVTGPGIGTIIGTGRLTALGRRPANEFSLVACGTGEAAAWLAQDLRTGDVLSINGTVTGGNPNVLVSGGRELVRHGARFDDTTGRRPEGPNPLTFACVASNGTSVLLGVVDGRSSKSGGMTFDGLTGYLLALHCYDGMVFDGGGSTTMVARLPGQRSVSVVNHPSDGSPRHVADALLVVPT